MGRIHCCFIFSECAHPLMPPARGSGWTRRGAGDKGRQLCSLEPRLEPGSSHLPRWVAVSPARPSTHPAAAGGAGLSLQLLSHPIPKDWCAVGRHKGVFNPLGSTAGQLCPVQREQRNLAWWRSKNKPVFGGPCFLVCRVLRLACLSELVSQLFSRTRWLLEAGESGSDVWLAKLLQEGMAHIRVFISLPVPFINTSDHSAGESWCDHTHHCKARCKVSGRAL